MIRLALLLCMPLCLILSIKLMVCDPCWVSRASVMYPSPPSTLIFYLGPWSSNSVLFNYSRGRTCCSAAKCFLKIYLLCPQPFRTTAKSVSGQIQHSKPSASCQISSWSAIGIMIQLDFYFVVKVIAVLQTLKLVWIYYIRRPVSPQSCNEGRADRFCRTL